MQQLLNAKERSKAFWKFLFFFLIAVLLIITALYFDFRVPEKENKILRRENTRYQTQIIAQERFVQSMDEAKFILDSLEQPDANVAYLNQVLSGKLRELTELQYKDSSVYSRTNKTVLVVFLKLQDAQNKLVNLKDAPRQLADYKSRLDQTQRDLDQCRRDLELIRKANSGF